MNRVIPAWLTAYRAVLVALTTLAVVSFIVAAIDPDFAYRPGALALLLVVSVGVSAGVSALGAVVIGVPPGSDSWAITGLILFFLMPGITDAASLVSAVIAAGAAAASKYVLVWRRRLIVNPAVVGAVVTYALAYAEVSVGGTPLSSPSWWVASEPLFIPMLIIGVLLVTALREWWLVSVFVVVACATIGVVQAVRGGQDLRLWFVSTPTLFLASVMLPEPLSTPQTRWQRAVYGGIVAILMFCQYSIAITAAFSLEFVPQIALLAGCLYAFGVRLAARAPAGRIPLAVNTEQIASRTYRLAGTAPVPVDFIPGQWALLSAPRWRTPLWHSSRRVFSFADAPNEQPVEFGFTAR
ncbi:MAG: oxidoreductase, partial [Gordonia sp. (in: high G+C Gram-positive bacteria)]